MESQSIVGVVEAVPVILKPELAAAETLVTVPVLLTPGWFVVYVLSFVSIKPLMVASDFWVSVHGTVTASFPSLSASTG